MEISKRIGSKLLVFMLAFAVVFTYSVVPMNQAYAASKKPAKVVLKKAAGKTESAVSLSWNKASNAKKYEVYASTSAKKGFKKVATVKASKKTYTVKKFKDAALKGNTKYYFKVRAINGSKKGKFSKVMAAKTKRNPYTKAKLGKSKTATMSTYIDMSKYPAGQVVKVWVPIPKDDEYQKITDIAFDARGAKPRVTTESVNGNKMLYIEWDAKVAPADRKASLVFTGTRYEVKRTGLKEKSNTYTPKSVKAYINKESKYVKVKDPIVKEYAKKATKGKKGTLAKANAIYKWTIANLERIDNGETLVNAKGKKKTFKVEGCGYGDTVQILKDLKKFGRAGGHCTDINSTFVALCRASGIPAREMFGIRMNEDATGGQHCWAEFYLPGTGWVYADPGDVLKAIRPAGTGASVSQMKKARASALAKEKTKYFWGGVDENRIIISRGRDVLFNPKQSWGKCNTFGYPACEVNGKRIKDFTDAKNFVYKIDCIDYNGLESDPEKWASLGIKYSDIDFTKDFILDVRPDENYTKKVGHFVGSEHFDVSGDFDKRDLKKAYDKADGKRVVIVCNSGQKLARKAMQALKETGAYMPNVTYLIGGAGNNDIPKDDESIWVKPTTLPES